MNRSRQSESIRGFGPSGTRFGGRVFTLKAVPARRTFVFLPGPCSIFQTRIAILAIREFTRFGMVSRPRQDVKRRRRPCWLPTEKTSDPPALYRQWRR